MQKYFLENPENRQKEKSFLSDLIEDYPESTQSIKIRCTYLEKKKILQSSDYFVESPSLQNNYFLWLEWKSRKEGVHHYHQPRKECWDVEIINGDEQIAWKTIWNWDWKGADFSKGYCKKVSNWKAGWIFDVRVLRQDMSLKNPGQKSNTLPWCCTK